MAATDQGSPSSDQHSAGRRVSWRTRARQALVTVGLLGLVFPPLLVLPLRWINPATTAFMVQHWVTSAAPYYHWTDWDDISPHAPVAVIAAEDQTFFEHRGFDAGLDPGRTRRGPAWRSGPRGKHHLATGVQEPVPLAGSQRYSQRA